MFVNNNKAFKMLYYHIKKYIRNQSIYYYLLGHKSDEKKKLYINKLKSVYVQHFFIYLIFFAQRLG